MFMTTMYNMFNILVLTTLLLLLHAADAIPTVAPSPPCTNSYGPGLHEVELGFRRFLLAVPDGLPVRSLCMQSSR
jgi:hypothetical protein|eukprot:COSAG01_NODE_18793_length_1052_cov_42.479538_1_plen_75_part_00